MSSRATDAADRAIYDNLKKSAYGEKKVRDTVMQVG